MLRLAEGPRILKKGNGSPPHTGSTLNYVPLPLKLNVGKKSRLPYWTLRDTSQATTHCRHPTTPARKNATREDNKKNEEVTLVRRHRGCPLLDAIPPPREVASTPTPPLYPYTPPVCRDLLSDSYCSLLSRTAPGCCSQISTILAMETVTESGR